jgi:hypothetical protein
MRWTILAITLFAAGCAIDSSDSRPTGGLGMATSGAGPYIGASAGSSVGGGPLGSGEMDNRAGAK